MSRRETMFESLAQVDSKEGGLKKKDMLVGRLTRYFRDLLEIEGNVIPYGSEQSLVDIGRCKDETDIHNLGTVVKALKVGNIGYREVEGAYRQNHEHDPKVFARGMKMRRLVDDKTIGVIPDIAFEDRDFFYALLQHVQTFTSEKRNISADDIQKMLHDLAIGLDKPNVMVHILLPTIRSQASSLYAAENFDWLVSGGEMSHLIPAYLLPNDQDSEAFAPLKKSSAQMYLEHGKDSEQMKTFCHENISQIVDHADFAWMSESLLPLLSTFSDDEKELILDALMIKSPTSRDTLDLLTDLLHGDKPLVQWVVSWAATRIDPISQAGGTFRELALIAANVDAHDAFTAFIDTLAENGKFGDIADIRLICHGEHNQNYAQALLDANVETIDVEDDVANRSPYIAADNKGGTSICRLIASLGLDEEARLSIIERMNALHSQNPDSKVPSVLKAIVEMQGVPEPKQELYRNEQVMELAARTLVKIRFAEQEKACNMPIWNTPLLKKLLEESFFALNATSKEES